MAQNWFKHDYSARNDDKVLELRAEYGWKGYGLFFGLIEAMCEAETGCIDTARIGGLSVAYGLPKEELLGFIDFCLEIDLFYEDDEKLIRSGRVVKHLEQMNALKEAGKKGAKKRWDRGANRGANATPNAEKRREDKNREDNTSVIAIANDVPNASDSDTWESSIRIANKLLDSICEHDPTHRYNTNEPSVKGWVKDIDLALRRDGRTEEQMNFIIDAIFHNKHKFPNLWDQWATNIESGNKLREKFDTIKNQIKPKNGQSINHKIRETEEFLSSYEG